MAARSSLLDFTDERAKKPLFLRNHIAAVSGATGSGKTTLMVQLARALKTPEAFLGLWDMAYPPEAGIFHVWTEGQLPLVREWYRERGVDDRHIAPFWMPARRLPITNRKVQDDMIRRILAKPGTVSHRA